MLSLLTLFPLFLGSIHGVDETGTNLDEQFFSWSVQSLELPATSGEDFQVSVVLDDVFDTELVLHPYSVRADNFTVWEQGADGTLRAVAAPAISTYRGFVAGIPDSQVSALAMACGLFSLFLNLKRVPQATCMWFMTLLS
jgi:hypothetical protein